MSAPDTNIVQFKRPRYTTSHNWNGRWLAVDNVDIDIVEVFNTLDEAQEYVEELNRNVA